MKDKIRYTVVIEMSENTKWAKESAAAVVKEFVGAAGVGDVTVTREIKTIDGTWQVTDKASG